MNEIASILKRNDKAIFASSSVLLLGYLFFRKQIWETSVNKVNKLETNLKQLIKTSSNKSIKKIVITTAANSKGQIRRNLINSMKQYLIKNEIKVLINCSPQKLLKAGCQCFLQSMEENDSEYTDYYHNAMKAQYLIQDTISKIQLINQEENASLVVMICDNNAMDLKIMNKSQNLWNNFIRKYQIEEEELISSYNFIIHVVQTDSDSELDAKIKNIWQNHKQYHCLDSRDIQNGGQKQIIEKVYNFLKS